MKANDVEAAEILNAARKREAARAASYVPPDYSKLNAMVRRQRAALTRAVNSGQRANIIIACRDAVREWNAPGAMWPDDWSRWQRALNDAFPVFEAPSLEDLA